MFKWNYFGFDVVLLWLVEMDFFIVLVVFDGVWVCVDNEEFGYLLLGEDSLLRVMVDWC